MTSRIGQSAKQQRSRIRVAASVALALVMVLPVEAGAHHNGTVHDVVDKLDRGVTERVSISTSGEEANDFSASPYCRGGWSASDSGRFVAFASTASNLHPADVNGGIEDVFVYDRQKRELDLVSATPSGLASQSPDGGGASAQRQCAFAGLQIGSGHPVISGNGRYVAFVSDLRLTGEDDPEAAPWPVSKVFVRDLVKHTTELVSRTHNGDPALLSSGNSGLSISDNGRFVAFTSWEANLTKEESCPPIEAVGVEAPVVLPCEQVYVRDRAEEETSLISRSSNGEPGNAEAQFPSISGDGRSVVFESEADNLVTDDNNLCGSHRSDLVDLLLPSPCRDVFVHDLQTQETELISISRDGTSANDESQLNRRNGQAISDDGRFVAFTSYATDLVPANRMTFMETGSFSDSREYLYDRVTARTERVSVSSMGTMESSRSGDTSISDDGSHILTFMAGECLGCTTPEPFYGQFLHSRKTGQTDFVLSVYQGPPDAKINQAHLGGNSRFVVGHSAHNDVVENDTNDATDVFVREIGNYPLGTGPLGGSPPQDQDPPEDRICVTPDTCVPPESALWWEAKGTSSSALNKIGADLHGASLAYRPELGDLYAAIELEHMGPGLTIGPAGAVTGGNPSLLYGLRLEVGHKSYEVRATSLLGGIFGLFDCTDTAPLCTQVTTLKGGYGTTGERVVVSLPLDEIGLEDGGDVKDFEVFSAFGSYASGVQHIYDRLRIR